MSVSRSAAISAMADAIAWHFDAAATPTDAATAAYDALLALRVDQLCPECNGSELPARCWKCHGTSRVGGHPAVIAWDQEYDANDRPEHIVLIDRLLFDAAQAQLGDSGWAFDPRPLTDAVFRLREDT